MCQGWLTEGAKASMSAAGRAGSVAPRGAAVSSEQVQGLAGRAGPDRGVFL